MKYEQDTNKVRTNCGSGTGLTYPVLKQMTYKQNKSAFCGKGIYPLKGYEFDSTSFLVSNLMPEGLQATADAFKTINA